MNGTCFEDCPYGFQYEHKTSGYCWSTCEENWASPYNKWCGAFCTSTNEACRALKTDIGVVEVGIVEKFYEKDLKNSVTDASLDKSLQEVQELYAGFDQSVCEVDEWDDAPSSKTSTFLMN